MKNHIEKSSWYLNLISHDTSAWYINMTSHEKSNWEIKMNSHDKLNLYFKLTSQHDFSKEVIRFDFLWKNFLTYHDKSKIVTNHEKLSKLSKISKIVTYHEDLHVLGSILCSLNSIDTDILIRIALLALFLTCKGQINFSIHGDMPFWGRVLVLKKRYFPTKYARKYQK